MYIVHLKLDPMIIEGSSLGRAGGLKEDQERAWPQNRWERHRTDTAKGRKSLH